MMLSRLTSSDENREGTYFPFGQSNQIASDGVVESPLPSPSALQTDSSTKQSPRLSSWSVAKVHWRATGALINAYLFVARLYRHRGSARDTEAFLTEAIDFCRGANCTVVHSTCLLERGVLYHKMGMREKGKLGIEEGSALVEVEEDTMGAMEMHIAHAVQQERAGDLQGNLQYLDKAEDIRIVLQEKLRLCLELPAVKDKPPQKGSIASPNDMILLSNARSRILLHRARISSRLGEHEEGITCIRQVRSNLISREHQKEDLQEAKIQICLSSQSLRRDQVMGMLHESVLTMPRTSRSKKVKGQDRLKSKRSTLMSSGVPLDTAQTCLKVAQVLLEKLTREGNWQRIDSLTLREACVNLAFIANLGGILGETCKPLDVVSVLERACSLTLQREMLDAIESKLDQRVGLMTFCIPGWRSSSEGVMIARNGGRHSSEGSSSDEEGRDEEARTTVDALRSRHALLSIEADLPSNYTVISITMYRERNCLVLTRRSGQSPSKPVVCHLPIDRQNHREGEENSSASIEAVLLELKTVVDESNEATHSAQHLQGMQARKEWWTKRRDLDSRLKSLLELIETTWLGAFKSVLMPGTTSTTDELDTLGASIDAFFQRSLFMNSTSDKMNLNDIIDDSIFQCFASLSQATCTDEELEDLIHYIMDAYQFKGCPVAVDEVDMDQCVTDLRTIFDAFKSKSLDKDGPQDHHFFLILDKNTSAIPWESLPILRDQAVCRIPSLAFLQDRLDQLPKGCDSSRFLISSRQAKVSYLLNPSKDLTRTQERFGPWLEGKAKSKKSNWSGISNRVPLMDELANALQNNDLLLYFGHGGAEQYIRASRLKSLRKCAVTMLWGCSSAVLKDMGDYDRIGTPYNYLMAGCPSLLGNLWDTTDKELDGISESVFQKMGLWKDDGDVKREGAKGETNLSIAQAVAKSRNACKLPYLTGAACVIYGIPVYYQ